MRWRHTMVVIATHTVMTAAVFVLGWAHGRYIGDYEFFDSSRLPWTFAYAALLVATAHAAGVPDEPSGGYRWAFGSAAIAAAGAALGISVAQLVTGSQLLPRFVIFWSSLFAVAWYWLCAALSDDTRRRGRGATRVALVSGDAEADRLRSELQGEADLVATLSYAEGRASLGETLEALEAEVVVLDREAQADEKIVASVVDLHGRGVRVRTLSMFYEQWLGKLPVSELERVSLLFDIGELHHRGYGRVKRLGDFIGGAIMLLVVAVLTPIVVLGNLIGNRGATFYRQERVGRSGRVFTLYKFRTMRTVANSDVDQGEWTTTDDTRVTPFGHVLRRTHLDEIPQAWNIVRGDLSMVGPRPEQPRYVQQLASDVPFYDVRHLVRPGLTGWAQVRHAYGATVDEARQKLQYDFYYLRHQSLVFDIGIMLRTVRSVTLGRGR